MRASQGRMPRNYLGRHFQRQRARDRLTREGRSRVMSRVKSKETGLERRFLRFLRRAKLYGFAKNVKNVLGKPDVIYRKEKLAIFIDSDFWHGWYYPRWKHLLKNDFWREKIERNRARDRKISRTLRRAGWTVLRFWEHEIRLRPEQIIKNIKARLKR